MPAYFDSFCSTVKLAFGPVEADRVLQLAKARKLSPSFFGNQSKKMQGVVSLLPAKKQVKYLTDQYDYAFKDLPSELFKKHRAAIAKQRSSFPAGGAILQNQPATAVLAPDPTVRRAIPPNQRKMIEAVTKGHELDEISTSDALSFRRYGHNSPDVILREHNRITTLPAEYRQVGELFSKAREGAGESQALAAYGIDYGKSGRLSRHARKRITEDLERPYAGRKSELQKTRNAHGVR
jgi:hypothetical protein